VAEAHEAMERLRQLLPEERRVILEWKARGETSREIADRLGVSERTVQRVLEDLKRRAGPELVGEREE
jgi:RNA polymerase sigma-70 factor (ECF subfamily)